MKFIFIIHSEGKSENAFSAAAAAVALVDTILCSYCVEVYGFAHFTTIKCNKIKSMPCTMHTLSQTCANSSSTLLLSSSFLFPTCAGFNREINSRSKQ